MTTPDQFRNLRSTQPSRPSSEAYAQMERMRAVSFKESDRDLNRGRSLTTKLDGTSSLELKVEMAKLYIHLEAMERRLIRWMTVCFLGQTVVLAGLGYFALRHLAR